MALTFPGAAAPGTADTRQHVPVVVLVALTALATLITNVADGDVSTAVLLSLHPVATVVGLRLYRPNDRRPWLLLTAALTSYLAANLLSVTLGRRFPLTLVFEISGYCLQIAGLMLLVRLRSDRRAGALSFEFVIFAVGAWIASWVLTFEPAIELGGQSFWMAVFDNLYQPIDIVLALLTMQMAFSDSFRVPAQRYLVVAASTQLLGDVLYALMAAGRTGDTTTAMNLCYGLALAAAAAAPLHPSMLDATLRRDRDDRVPAASRVFIVAVGLVTPVGALVLTGPANFGDEAMLCVSAIISCVLAIGYVLHLMLINEAARSDLFRMATTDSLTGLANRSQAVERLALLTRMGRPVTIAFVDVDRFKQVNDSLGHAVGDLVLRTTGERLSSASNREDIVARISGDEFAVISSAPMNLAEARELGDRLLRAIRRPMVFDTGEAFVGASIGLLFSRASASQPDDLLRAADTAMYAAKDAGRNRVELFDERMQEQAVRRSDTANALRHAVERDELVLHYQPVIDLYTGRVTGVEALMRWNRPGHGLVPPDQFIPVAEDTGLIVELGAWALHRGLSQLAQWIEARVCAPDMTVAINVSARQLIDDGLMPTITGALEQARLSPSHLVVEVTETLMITDPDRTSKVLHRVRDLGAAVSVDDFGTGYSSLSAIRTFPVDEVKLDRRFIADMATLEKDRAIVASILQLARALGMHTVAEGVELPEQVTLLQAMGCPHAQGYLFSRPLPAEDVAPLLSTRLLDVHASHGSPRHSH